MAQNLFARQLGPVPSPSTQETVPIVQTMDANAGGGAGLSGELFLRPERQTTQDGIAKELTTVRGTPLQRRWRLDCAPAGAITIHPLSDPPIDLEQPDMPGLSTEKIRSGMLAVRAMRRSAFTSCSLQCSTTTAFLSYLELALEQTPSLSLPRSTSSDTPRHPPQNPLPTPLRANAKVRPANARLEPSLLPPPNLSRRHATAAFLRLGQATETASYLKGSL
ncbi:hypothetical protein NMY22_g9157 [Coprinellus aureogranulatus]|nr:hypothetical protein NMY22_g9157 [Coprinellus aureogranulatus]